MSFIEREHFRIQQELPKVRGTSKHAELCAAKQALAWALDPEFTKSPYDMIMATHLIQEDCSDAPDPLQS